MIERDVAIRGAERTVDGYLVLPENGPSPRPAVIVIHEIFGPDAHIRDVAQRFARLGYVALAPNLFTGEFERVLTPENIRLAMLAFAEAPPDLRADPSKFTAFIASQPSERRPALQALGQIRSPSMQKGFTQDLVQFAEHLRGLPEVDPDRVGSVGFCFGGGMSALLATADPRLAAAVIFYGSNPPLEEIPKIHARMLGLYGSEDPGITDTVPAFARSMAEAQKSFAYHVYPGAKHAFFNDSRESHYHAESAQDAWRRVVEFFGETIGPR